MINFSSIAQTPEELNTKGKEYYYAENYTKAVECYCQAAEQGYAEAQYALGICYDNGNGVAQNYTEAVKWWRKAAEQGYASAQYNLGLCYYYGDGVVENYTEAVKWIREAAKQGQAKAVDALKVLGEKSK